MAPRSACLLAPDTSLGDLPTALSALIAQQLADRLSCAAVAEELAETWELAEPLRAAVTMLAEEGDRSGIDNSYHNPAHTRDVAVIWGNLAMRNRDAGATRPLDRTALALGLCGAFGHDLLHDGMGNVLQCPPTHAGGPPRRQHVPFRLERVAADHTAALMAQCGVAPALVASVVAAILSTEPIQGYGELALPGPLDDPIWRMLALLLRDADVLASIGLTAADHDRQSSRLAGEFCTDLNTRAAAETLFAQAATERFLSPAGKLFRPQFEALRALNHLRSDGSGQMLEAAALRLARA